MNEATTMKWVTSTKYCVFRSKSATDSGVNRPPIPIESGH